MRRVAREAATVLVYWSRNVNGSDVLPPQGEGQSPARRHSAPASALVHSLVRAWLL